MMVKLNTFDLSTDRRKMLRMHKIVLETGLCSPPIIEIVHEGGAKVQNMLKCVAEEG